MVGDGWYDDIKPTVSLMLAVVCKVEPARKDHTVAQAPLHAQSVFYSSYDYTGTVDG